MKKKLTLVTLSAACALTCALAFSACDLLPHDHTWSEEWSNDDSHHWHACTKEGCMQKNDYAEHDFSGGDCICGKKQTEQQPPPAVHVHEWDAHWSKSAAQHWHACIGVGCDEQSDRADHDFSNGDCACGAKNPSVATLGLEYTLNSDEESYTVTGIGTATDTDVVIPSEYEGKSVTAVGELAFRENALITSITVQNGVTTIGERAFLSCTALTDLILPDSVTEIGFAATGYCSALKSLVIPASVTSLGQSMCAKCDALEHITIDGENETYACIGNCVIEKQSKTLLFGCNNSVIPTDGSVNAIGDRAFSLCSNLTELHIPDGVQSIGNWAFAADDSLKNIVLPDSVTAIGEDVFQECTALESITAPFLGSSIGNTKNAYLAYWFNKNSSRNNANYLPQSLKHITLTGGRVAEEAFMSCKYLVSVTLCEGVTAIDSQAFYDCPELTAVSIPNSVTEINSYAFEQCDKLQFNRYEEGLYLGNEKNPYVLFVRAANTSVETFVIQKDAKFMLDDPFELCENLKSLTIPSGITKFDISDVACDESITVAEDNPAYASHCGILYNKAKTEFQYIPYKISGTVELPNSLTAIKDEAFRGRSVFTGITIPNSIKSIGNRAFYGCASLAGITLPDSVTAIGDNAFYGCEKLTNLVLPNSLAELGNRVFENCSKLQFTTYENACYLGSASNPHMVLVKAANKNITSCTVHQNTKYIQDFAFYSCEKLERLTLPFLGASKNAEGYKAVFGYIFGFSVSNNAGSTSQVLQYIDKSNPNQTKYYMYNIQLPMLENVILTEALTKIGDCAFRGYGFSEIEFKGTTQQWNKLPKGTDWNFNSALTTVHCSNGDVDVR